MVNKIKEAKRKLIRLDIACGQCKKDGFIGIDIANASGVDIVHDLFKYPWPIESEVVEEAHCSHFFEHIPGLQRPLFMGELYRILAPDGKCLFVVPHGHNERAFQDWSHAWPPVVAASFLYFNQQWVHDNKLDHGGYRIPVNFNFSYGYSVNTEWAQRQDEMRSFALRNYVNAIMDLHVMVEKIPLLKTFREDTRTRKNGAVLKGK